MKRENTCGSTPKVSTDANGEPVARTPSTCFVGDFLDRLGEELADEADRRDRQREDAGERAESHRLHEQDRHDDRMKRARGDDDRARRPAHPRGHEVARGREADGKREHDPEHRGEHRDLQAFREALHEEVPAREVGREHAREEPRCVVEADVHALPRDFHLRARVDHVGDEREGEKPRPPAAPERGRKLGGGFGARHRYCNQSSPP